jgi:hypothetical protein
MTHGQHIRIDGEGTAEQYFAQASKRDEWKSRRRGIGHRPILSMRASYGDPVAMEEQDER